MNFRSLLYFVAKIMGDVQAIGKDKIGRRIGRRVAGRTTGKILGRLFK